jgi:CyaY protein
VPGGAVGATGVIGAVDAGLFAASGSRSGPFCPHAASEATAAARARARIMPGIMTESEFHRAVDGVLARIESSVEDVDALDVDLESGILTVTCPDDSRVIVNRQTPNREIWVAARSGGFHFAWKEGAWRDTRSADELFASLTRIIESQAGVRVDWK